MFTVSMKAWVRVAVLLLMVGCGNSLPPRADPDKARDALRTALDAWQKGETSQTLAQRSPPLYFNEPRCTSEVRLVKYQMDDAHTPYGQSVRLTAQLTLALKDGTTQERKARYLIDTAPAVVIVAE